MITERINDPQRLDPVQIERMLQNAKTVTIQFGREIYNPTLLEEVDSLCHRFEDRLEVRFYGHYPKGFDASYLRFVPNVRRLLIDCLMHVTGLEHLYRLERLTMLSLGVHELDEPDVLHNIQVAQLRELRLGDTRRNNIDLAPLSKFTQLDDFGLAGHHNNFDSISEIPKLETLRLRCLRKDVSLEAVGRIRSLRKLSIMLGGRANLNEVAHSKLEDLEIARILGFSDPGNLGRFPALQKLHIADQIRLKSLDLTHAPLTLEEVVLGNCKKLREVGPLDHLVNLKSLRLVLTAVDFEKLLALRRPPNLRQIVFYSGKRKADAKSEARLSALGYSSLL